MDVSFGDFSLHERKTLFEETPHSIEFIWQDGIDEKVCSNDKVSSRARKVVKQRVVPMGTSGAVQFSEKCLKQKEGGIKVDSEIIFQTPLPITTGADATTSSDVTEGNISGNVHILSSQKNEETSSFLNASAPEFVPEATSDPIKDEGVVGSDDNASASSQAAQPYKYRHFNKQQMFHPSYPMIPDYHMIRGIPSHLPLPCPPYFIPPRHSREPLIPLGLPLGYPYPQMHLQHSRMFPDGFAPRHPHIYAAGMPPDVYMMEIGGHLTQDGQHQLYTWGGVPEPQLESPEPEEAGHDDVVEVKENTRAASPHKYHSNSTEPASCDGVISPQQHEDMVPVSSTSDNISTVIETSESHSLESAGGSHISNGNSKTEFTEDVHPIKDNSTGQVVDTGYIHKHIDSIQDENPELTEFNNSQDQEILLKNDLECVAVELSQEDQSSVDDDQSNCVTLATDNNDVCDEVEHPVERAQAEEMVETVTPHPQPTLTSVSADSDVKTEEESASTGLSISKNTSPSTPLGNKLTESKVKPTAGESHHMVDRKVSSGRSFNNLSYMKENSHTRTDTPASSGSSRISAKGATKSGASIILRTVNAPEKKNYQQQLSNSESLSASNKDPNRSSNFSSISQAEAKKSQFAATTAGFSTNKETSLSNGGSNSSTPATTSQGGDVKKAPPVAAWGQTKKWSLLFNASSKDAASTGKDAHTQNSSGLSSSSETVVEQRSTPPNPEFANRQLKSLGEQLKSITVDHKSYRPFVPRGLVNRGNLCYVHTTLQVLLSCPSVYNLFSSLNQFPLLSKDPSATPLTDCMIQFTSEFSSAESDSEASQKANRKKKGIRDLGKRTPFHPDYVYNVLHKMRSSLTVKGMQEDAEEFLGSILDGLHEEMVEAKKAVSPVEEGNSNTAGEVLSSSSVSVNDEDDEWEEVGHKNKSTITRVVSSFAESHITEIFGGKMRSAVHHQGAKESATVQPFFSLQLDVQASDVMSVEDALSRLSVKEPLHGFTCSKTQTEVEAFKRITLSQLPAVLILHLKRFSFNQTGGLQKLGKEVTYPLELEIPKELLAPTLVKGKNKTYKLTGVIYHHGKLAGIGHYTCDVYHPSCGGWIRLDDSLIRSVCDEQVVKHYKDRSPYLLFYQKSDISCNR